MTESPDVSAMDDGAVVASPDSEPQVQESTADMQDTGSLSDGQSEREQGEENGTEDNETSETVNDNNEDDVPTSTPVGHEKPEVEGAGKGESSAQVDTSPETPSPRKLDLRRPDSLSNIGKGHKRSFSDLRLPKPRDPSSIAARTHLANALDKLRGDISITPRRGGDTVGKALAAAPTPGSSYDRTPLLVCYSCGEEYSSATLNDHLIDCPKNRRDAIQRMPESVPRPMMKLRKPEMAVPSTDADVIDVLFYNMQAREIWEESFVECRACEKSFPSTWEGIGNHYLNNCTVRQSKANASMVNIDINTPPMSPRTELSNSQTNKAAALNASTKSAKAGSGNGADDDDKSSIPGESPVSPRSPRDNNSSPRSPRSPRDMSPRNISPRAGEVPPDGPSHSRMMRSALVTRSRAGSSHAAAATALGLGRNGKSKDAVLTRALLDTVSTIVTRTFGESLSFEDGFTSNHLPLRVTRKANIRDVPLRKPDPTKRIFRKGPLEKAFPEVQKRNRTFRRSAQRAGPFIPIAGAGDHRAIPIPPPGHPHRPTFTASTGALATGQMNQDALAHSQPVPLGSVGSATRGDTVTPREGAAPIRRRPVAGHRQGVVAAPNVRFTQTRASEAHGIRTAGSTRKVLPQLGTSVVNRRHHRKKRKELGGVPHHPLTMSASSVK